MAVYSEAPGTLEVGTDLAQRAAVASAVAAGERDPNRLTDLVFGQRHPELRGRSLRPDEQALIQEWIQLRGSVVLPALASPSAPAVPPSPYGGAGTGGFALQAVESPGGGRIRDKRDPSPADLVTVTGVVAPVKLHRLAASAWSALVASARAAGIPAPILLPTSGYRPREHQARLWAEALKKHGSEAAARKWVAPPGGSPHQSGRAIDLHLGGRNQSETAESLRVLPAYRFLVANAARFGFYPYDREPWHWEYNPPPGGAGELNGTSHELGTGGRRHGRERGSARPGTRTRARKDRIDEAVERAAREAHVDPSVLRRVVAARYLSRMVASMQRDDRPPPNP